MALEEQRKGSHSWWSWRGRDALCKTILYSAADVPSFWWPAQLQNHASPYHNILRSYFISAPRFDEHMRQRWLSALRCQTGPSSTNCPLAVLIIFWHNQLGWECASLRQRSLPKCYHQCKAASPSLSGEMPSFFAQIETRLYNMLAIHKLSPTRLCSGLVHVFFCFVALLVLSRALSGN